MRLVGADSVHSSISNVDVSTIAGRSPRLLCKSPWASKSGSSPAVRGYLTVLAASVAIAHLWAGICPDSDVPARIVAPIQTFLVLVDEHWRAMLIFVVPLLFPLLAEIKKLIPHIRSVTVGKDSVRLNLQPVDKGIIPHAGQEPP
jgi:hypothetical protein